MINLTSPNAVPRPKLMAPQSIWISRPSVTMVRFKIDFHIVQVSIIRVLVSAVNEDGYGVSPYKFPCA